MQYALHNISENCFRNTYWDFSKYLNNGKNFFFLRDVAQAAGVSLTTASRALNNKSYVQPETRALVLKAAADLGYRLQVRAASAVPAELNTIGVLIKRDPFGSSRLDTFYYAVLSGIEDECQRLGLNLMYASLPVNEHSVGNPGRRCWKTVTWTAC